MGDPYSHRDDYYKNVASVNNKPVGKPTTIYPFPTIRPSTIVTVKPTVTNINVDPGISHNDIDNWKKRLIKGLDMGPDLFPINNEPTVLFRFFDVDACIERRESTPITIRGGKKYPAKEIIQGDVIKNSRDEWGKILKVKK